MKVFDWKTYIFTAVAVISFSNFMVVLFGQTIPATFMTFFRYAGETIILGSSVFVCTVMVAKGKTTQSTKEIFNSSI